MSKPESHSNLSQEQEARVWAKIERGEPDACWAWTAKAKDKKGRGKIRIDKKLYHVPRLLWELAHGALPLTLMVYETCFTGGCCNPAHLDAATQSEIQALVWRHKNGEPKDRKLAQRRENPQTGAKVYPVLTDEDRERFWAKVERAGPDDCWEWNAGSFTAGYGGFAVTVQRGKKRVLKASRLAYILTHGPITPVNRVIRHTCDNPPCCNPAHLVLGTQVQNMADHFGG